MTDIQPVTRVLVVEDEDPVRLSLRRYLTRVGHDVTVASDGLAAIKLLLDQDVDVIVSDYRMDVFGGDYWVRFLQKYCTDKKVIITSGFLRPEFEIEFPILYKPFDYSDLDSLIRSEVGRTPEGA